MPDVAAHVRVLVAQTDPGSFLRDTQVAAALAVTADVARASLDTLTGQGLAVRCATGLYYKGKATRFGMTGPNLYALALELAVDHGYTSGVGPADYTAINALGMSTQMPNRVLVAVPGPAPGGLPGLEFVSRPRSRTGLGQMDVAVLETLGQWDRRADRPWSDLVAAVRRMAQVGEVDLRAVLRAAELEAHTDAVTHARTLARTLLGD